MAVEMQEIPMLRQLIRDEATTLLLDLGIVVPKQETKQIEVTPTK